MNFTFKHPETGEIKIVFLSENQIQNLLADHLQESLTCDCEPIGETNVVECGCEDYVCEFELQERN